MPVATGAEKAVGIGGEGGEGGYRAFCLYCWVCAVCWMPPGVHHFSHDSTLTFTNHNPAKPVKNVAKHLAWDGTECASQFATQFQFSAYVFPSEFGGLLGTNLCGCRLTGRNSSYLFKAQKSYPTMQGQQREA